MKGPSKQVIDAIKADEFATAAVEAAIRFVYVSHRDWHHISRDGKILFDSEAAGLTYAALCCLVDRKDPPDVDGTINIEGVDLSMRAIRSLEKSIHETFGTKET